MIALIIGGFFGFLLGLVVAYIAWSILENLSDRDRATGPLPLMPPPAPPIPADILVGYQPRHRKERVR